MKCPPHVGSGPEGQPLSVLLCTNATKDAPRTFRCTKIGSLKCSQCHLVNYCSKDCQTQHWKAHRADCKGPVINTAWRPAWIKQKRRPTFMDMDDSSSTTPTFATFGLPYAYLWGNLPAIDCLNLPENERTTATTRDFKICFAASGDIRNLIRTITSLPAGYQGQCDILFNDLNPLVVGHNVVVLWALLNPTLTEDEAVELAIHLMYSSMLTPAMENFLLTSLDVVHGLTDGRSTSIPVNGRGTLNVFLGPKYLDVTKEMLQAKYGQRIAKHAYKSVMWSPERQDYTDRFLNGLEAGHRLSFLHHRASGILAPFSLDVSGFTEPNRLLYTPKGEWLLRDDATPLQGWDMSLVFAYGQRYGVDRADAYGCLFFYLKNELSTFAKRLRGCRINITMTMADATALPKAIAAHTLPPFSPGCFDRIETSNLADYISAPSILRGWAPFLNRGNKCASILINFMNWQKRYPVMPDPHGRWHSKATAMNYMSIMGIDVEKMMTTEGSSSSSPGMIKLYSGMAAFSDDHDKFQSFLHDQNIEKIAGSCGLKLRNINRIHPKRAGAPLKSTRISIPSALTKSEYYNTFWIGQSEPTTRFVEFELKA
ncbi:hypothetical protein DXG01_010301 [Tephrocybe rancida]|nr:hypothetical protein DXG01_010301 [Tephrocybe rancida]